VVDDYYKRGLAINQTLTRDRTAVARGYRADLAWEAGAGRLRVALSGAGTLPPSLQLRIVHPTRAGLDQRVMLPSPAREPTRLRSRHRARGAGLVTLEDESRNWRLTGEWRVPEQAVLQLVASSLSDLAPTGTGGVNGSAYPSSGC